MKPSHTQKNKKKQHERELYESVIVLIDPDMLILRPFLFHLKETSREYAIERNEATSEYEKYWVRKGHPVSQRYGIGNKWVMWKVCPEERKGCKEATAKVANDHYSIGPPYIMHIEDWKVHVGKWVEYSPISLEKDPPPSMLAEMYSFAIASA